MGEQRVRIWMKTCSPLDGQNDQLVHWWVLIHSGLCKSSTYLPTQESPIETCILDLCLTERVTKVTLKIYSVEVYSQLNHIGHPMDDGMVVGAHSLYPLFLKTLSPLKHAMFCPLLLWSKRQDKLQITLNDHFISL